MNHPCNPMKQAPGSPVAPACENWKLLEESVDMLEQTTWAIHRLLELFEDVEETPHGELLDDAYALMQRIEARLDSASACLR